jgi:hypothetical protein
MPVALAAVALLVLPLAAAAVWLGLRPSDPGEHPDTGEFVVHIAEMEEELAWAEPPERSESAA